MTRIIILTAVIVTTSLLLASGYSAAQVCAVPLLYRIDTLDERFDLTQDEAKAALTAAEAVWEEATGRELFVYDESADFTVNFVFDDRQERTIAEQALRDSLDQKEDTSESIQAQYDALKKDYQALASSYEADVVTYEEKIAAFNAEVARYNEQGGAPADVYQSLELREAALESEASALARRARELESVVANLNALGERGNRLIDQYNTGVDTYNKRFGEANEFTQGDYQGTFINVYSFTSETELHKVLIHELGHALNIGHVEGSESFMYYLLEDQPDAPRLSEADLAAFAHACGTKSGVAGWLQKTHTTVVDVIKTVINK